MFVFRMISFILILKCLVTCTYSQTDTEIEANIQSKTEPLPNSTKSTNSTSDKTKEITTIIGEGGEKLSVNLLDKNTMEAVHHVNSAPTPMSRPYGREDVINKDKPKTNSSNAAKVADLNVTLVTNISTEAIKPVTEKSFTEKASTANPSEENSNEKSTTETPVTVDKTTPTTHSRIVPKKGVNFNETVNDKYVNTPTISSTVENSSITVNNTTIESTTKAEMIRKPTVTTGSEDNKDALPKEKESSNSTPKVPTIEYYQKKKEDNKRSTFIIPIIAVIFSVPLVAIILNVLYKHCKEWWSHRHYRRMDFLIDGMYNN